MCFENVNTFICLSLAHPKAVYYNSQPTTKMVSYGFIKPNILSYCEFVISQTYTKNFSLTVVSS